MEQEYIDLMDDVFDNDDVQQLKNFSQHGSVSRFDHCLYVSYVSYKVSRRLGLDYRAAARGGMLHDLFLYDWRDHDAYVGNHIAAHPKNALRNARKQFTLSKREKEIILKHMWPLTIVPPKYAESYVVQMADKYCAVMEALRLHKAKAPKYAVRPVS